MTELAKHLATVNLWRNPDNSLSVTFAEANGVADEIGGSGAPLHLCAMTALRAAVIGDDLAQARLANTNPHDQPGNVG